MSDAPPRVEAMARLRPLTHVGGVVWDIEDGRALEVILDALETEEARIEIAARGEAAWGRYMSAEGDTSQALWQGKFDAFRAAVGLIRSALDRQVSQ